MNRFIAIISSFSLFIATSCITENEPETLSLHPGDMCPDFSVTMNDGSIITSSDLRGKRSVIVFFNTSCADCREELPEIQKVYDEILTKDLPVHLLCISRAEGEESIETFWHENNLTLPYSPQEDRSVYNLFASSVIPRIYLLSPDLTITRAWSDNPMPTSREIIDCL